MKIKKTANYIGSWSACRLHDNTGVPNLECICLSEGVHSRLGIQGKNIFVYYFFPNILKFGRFLLFLLSLFAATNFKGTCLPVEMLKGYMVWEWMGTPVITQQFLLWGVGIVHVSRSYGHVYDLLTNRMLLWWTLDSVPLPVVIKRKVVTEALQWSGERKCKVTSIKQNWQVNWTYNAITLLVLNDTFVRRTTDLEKTANVNWLLISLSATTIADAFLH